MCRLRDTDPRRGSTVSTVDSGHGSSDSREDSSFQLPDEAFLPKPGLVETYVHGKKVGNYLIGHELGAGSFAQVKEGLHVLTGERVAIKIVSKETTKTDPYVAKNMRREGRILQLIRHANVVQLLEVMETENSYYLVQELVPGGDFMALLRSRRRLTEAETRRYLRQMVQAVDYMHSLGVLHRDLKIENLLLTQEQNLKIIDFGLSNMVSALSSDSGSIVAQLCRTQCGSPAYAAPEVLAKKTYGSAVDVWSIGVNMFAMLTGNLPFTVKPFSIKALHQKMVNQEFNPLPRTLSAGCRDLLLRLLNPQPETRIRLRDVMSHPWLNENVSRLRPSPFPNLPSRADLNEDVLQQVSRRLLLPVDDVARKVLDNSPGPSLATYRLMSVMADRFRRESPKVLKMKSSASADSSLSKDSHENALTAAIEQPAEDLSKKPELEMKATQSSSLLNKEEHNEPLGKGLPRRERTFCGAVPVSKIAAETTELVRLSRAVSTGAQNDDASQTSENSTKLPKFDNSTPAGARVTAPSSTTSATPRQSTALPMRRLSSESGCVGGRSSIQSLLTQRYPAIATSRALPSPGARYSRYSLTSAANAAAAAGAAAAALAAASSRRAGQTGTGASRR